MKVATVTPFFRPTLAFEEQMSITALRNVLHDVEHIALTPPGLRVKGFTTAEFPGPWFDSPRSFDQLLLSPLFYHRFIDCDYLLIYRLGSLVFSPQLERFCRAGFDYIAPPALRGYTTGEHRTPIFAGCGHGGFSLRRVGACLEVFEEYARQMQGEDAATMLGEDGSAGLAHEGYFWARRAGKFNPRFKVAPTDVAFAFGWGKYPAYCFAESDGQLPFGCDAWATHDREFWLEHRNGSRVGCAA